MEDDRCDDFEPCPTRRGRFGSELELHFSKLIKISEFRQSWLDSLTKEVVPIENLYENTPANEGDQSSAHDVIDTFCEKRNNDSSLSTQIDTNLWIPPDLEAELAEVCDNGNLRCEGESNTYEFSRKTLMDDGHVIHNVPESVNLITLKRQKRDLWKRWVDTRYSASTGRRYRFAGTESLLVRKQKCNLPIQDTCRLGNDSVVADSGAKADQGATVAPIEVVLTVKVCIPSTNLRRAWKSFGERFQVLGSQKLTELRDKITCMADNIVPGDCSSHPDQPMETTAKDLYKSGFFFINGVFYNDMRDPSCRDYSKVIIGWANEPGRHLEPYSSKNMEDATFDGLEIRLGYPYLYRHQGDCEHVIVFTDIRLWNGDDCAKVSGYPICYGGIVRRKTQCMVCHNVLARWIVKNNPRLPMEPYLMCNACFESFNYLDGEKIGEFVAYRFNNDRVSS